MEIFLGNHTANNDTLGRHKRQLENPDGPNPFVDATAWGKYLDEKKKAMEQLIASGE